MCSFYEEAGVQYLAAGMVAHANIEKSQAEIVAYVIWQYKMDKQKSLFDAYEAIREMHLALDELAPSAEGSKRQRHDPVTEPADETAGLPDEEQEEEAIPLRPPDRMRPTDSWTHVIATGSDSLNYYVQLHKCNYLHEWCNQRWGTMHMSWETFNKKKKKLKYLLRFRVIYQSLTT